MRILYINNDGGGFATHLDIQDGTTVGQLFEKQVPGRDASDYLIRVDRQPVSADHVLQDGQRCSFTPVKIEGARSVCSKLPRA